MTFKVLWVWTWHSFNYISSGYMKLKRYSSLLTIHKGNRKWDRFRKCWEAATMLQNTQIIMLSISLIQILINISMYHQQENKEKNVVVIVAANNPNIHLSFYNPIKSKSKTSLYVPYNFYHSSYSHSDHQTTLPKFILDKNWTISRSRT